MSSIQKKPTPLRLATEGYAQLRRQVLRRDRWKCQFCGSTSNLEVHHNEFRSHSGADTDENLITLCHHCHFALHRR